MSKYQLCAIGNALLDMDMEVSEETLKRLNIEKSVMTLIDADRERELLEQLDGIKHLTACGGSAANTAVVFGQLGGDVFYSCKVANDHAGDLFYQDLVGKGIHTNLSESGREAGITGKCLAMVTPDADRTMNTYLGITADFSVKELNVDAIANAEYIYIEGYLVASPTAFEACLEACKVAKQHNTKIVLTLSDPNMTKFFGQHLKDIAAHGLDLLFCNQEEAALFCDQTDVDAILETLKQHSKRFVMTCGEHGAKVFDGEAMIDVVSFQVKPIDTTGAGDVFAGAFLYAITHGCDFAAAGKFASLAGAKVVSKFGPRLDDSEIKNLLDHRKQLEPAIA